MKKALLLFFALIATFFVYAGMINTEDSLQHYTGKYKFPEGSAVTEVVVTLENGILTGSSMMGSSELKRMQGDSFEVVAYSGVAIFKRNTENKINAIHLMVGDIDIEGTKTDEINSMSRYLFFDHLRSLVFDLPKLKRKQFFLSNSLLFPLS